MSGKLIRLCELQLSAVGLDMDSSLELVNQAAGRLMLLCHAHINAPAKAAAINEEAMKIVVGLQFQDELSQRIANIMTLLELVKGRSLLMEFPESDEVLLAQVSSIFSSQAEFRQLAKIFPGSTMPTNTNHIELF